jgi:branched-chain amino acid transport system substrate-binding protein
MKATKRAFVLGLTAASVFPGMTRAKSGSAEIRIGTTGPLSGPAAVYGLVNTAMDAYFSMVNDAGGINGRKVKLIIADDAYTPNRTLEQTRKLVESEKVLFMLGQVGSTPALAARPYLNDAKIPQLFVGSGAPTWLDDIKKFPWSLAVQPSYVDEGRAIADHITTTRPNARVALLFQNDDAGRGYARGLREGLSAFPGMIVKEETTEMSEPTVDSQVIALHSTGADVLVSFTIPRGTSQTIRRVRDLQWSPQIYLGSVSTSIQQALAPAGLDRAKGIVSVAYMREMLDPVWEKDAGVQSMVALMKKYKPQAALELPTALGLTIGMLGTEVIRQCGNNVTRENLVKQTANLDLTPPLLLPRLIVKTMPEKRAVLSKVRLQQFDGTGWKLRSWL